MKQLKNKGGEKSVLEVIQYFSNFNYPPDLDEIHTFLKKKASKGQITGILQSMEKRSLITAISNSKFLIFNQFLSSNEFNFKNLILNKNFKLKIANSASSVNGTPPQYIKRYYKAIKKNNAAIQQYNNFFTKQKISTNKLDSPKFRFYLKILRLFPQIKLVGLSGSVAMLNAEEDHDIDLFIITAKNRLWTGRFIAILLAKILGIHRGYNSSNTTIQQYSNLFKDRICLNLFFDQSDLIIPGFKRSDYVAHEVLQMKPLIDKAGTYLSFIDANKWVFDIFQNSRKIFRSKFLIINKFKISNLKLNKNLKLKIVNFGDYLENSLRKFQLGFIRKHQTTELITDSQLWFHPDDFAKKIKGLKS